MDSRRKGKLGERLAKDFLIRRGYLILEENFWCRYGEIDLIAKDSTYLVFIEVKLVKNRAFVDAKEQVNYSKREHLKRVARYYLSYHQLDGDFRFDVVAISNGEIELIQNAFLV